MLEWARERAGLPIPDAARRLGTSDNTLVQWESSAIRPTMSQLRKIASVYRVPLANFLLVAPPKVPDALVKLRSLQGSEGSSPRSQAFTSVVQRAVDQQAVMRDLADRGILEPRALIRIEAESLPDTAANTIRDWLGVTWQLQEEWVRQRRSLRGWTDRLEGNDILVLQAQRVPVPEMRGFSLIDAPYPVVCLNGADAKTAKLFTLIHELVHVLRAQAGQQDVHVTRGTGAHDALERFCNRVAAAVLMPKTQVEEESDVLRASSTTQWNDSSLRRLSSRYGVSRDAFLLRLVEIGRADSHSFKLQAASYYSNDELVDEDEANSSNAPLYYPLKVRDLGRKFIVSVGGAFDREELSSRDASLSLGVKLDRIPRLLQEATR